jgi:hypothetical protein
MRGFIQKAITKTTKTQRAQRILCSFLCALCVFVVKKYLPAVAATAAVATATTTTAVTTTTTATATIAATTTAAAATALLTLLGFAYLQSASMKHRAIELTGNCVYVPIYVYKSKPLGLPCIPICNDTHGINVAKGTEQFSQIILGCAIGYISHIDSHQNFSNS